MRLRSVPFGSALCSLLFALLALPAMAAPKVSTQTGGWGDADTWGGSGAPGASDDVFVASGHTVTISGLDTLQINSLSVSGLLEHIGPSATESSKIILDIANDCTVSADGRIDVSAKGFSVTWGPGYPGVSNGSGSHGGRGRGNHATAYGDTYGSIVAPTNYGSGGGTTAGGGAVILTVGGETRLYGYIQANSGTASGDYHYPGAGGSVYLTTDSLTGSGTIEARSVANGFYTGGGGRIAVSLEGSDSFGDVTMITYASKDASYDGAAGTVYLEKQSDTDNQGELFLDQNNIAVSSPAGYDVLTTMSDAEAVSYQFSRVTATNRGMITVGSDDILNLTGATLGGTSTNRTEGIIIDGGTLTVGSTWAISNMLVTIRAGSTFDVTSALTIGSLGTLAIDGAHTISGDVAVQDGGVLTHSDNSTTEAYRMDLTVGGELQIDLGGELNVDLKGYATKQGPGYVQYCGSYGGSGYAGRSPTYGSIVSPTNCGSGGQSSSGGGAAILTVTKETRLNGYMTASATFAGSWKYPGSGGSVFLTTSNLVGTGTMKASSGLPGGHFSGGGGRIAVHLTGAGSGFGSVEMIAYPEDSGLDSGAGTVYRRTASQGLNEGTLIIEHQANSSYYTTITSLVTDASVGDVIIGNNGKLKLGVDQVLQVSGNWSNGNTFVSDSGGRVELVGTDTATVFGSSTFKELVCTNVSKTIHFEDGETTSVDEVLRFVGPSNTGLLLRSTSPGDQWLLDVDAGATEITANYVDSRDSDASPGLAIVALNSKDTGNNDNWQFTVEGLTNVWTGGTSASWPENSNWSLDRPPAVFDGGVIISNNCSYYPTLPSDKTFGYFEMKNPSSMSLGGFDLTVEDDAVIAGTLTATATETITFEGDVNWTGGTFTEAYSTVLLADTDAQGMTSDSESCYRLTVTNSGRTVTFTDTAATTYFRNESVALTFSGGVTATEFRSYTTEGGVTQTFAASSTSTITDMFQLGSAGKTNYLVSSSGGTKWNLDVDRVAYVTSAHATDSDADPGMTVYPIDSFNGGNNDNWVFSETWLTWDGSASSDFSAAANWTPETAPDGTARCNIDGNGGNAPVVSSAVSVKEVLLGGDQTSSLTLNDSLTVSENVRVMGSGTLIASKPSTIGNDLTVLDGGTLTHGENTSTEAYKIDLTVGGDFYLGPDAEIDVDYRGYASGGPGYGPYGYGASYGGQGGGLSPAIATYGSISAPTNCGSSGTSARDGGGVVQLTVSGETRLYGYVRANGEDAGSYATAASGGSIFLTTSNLVGNATLEAKGGSSSSYASGGGGRIAVVLTHGTSFDQVTMDVSGGYLSSYDGAAGTIYQRVAGQGPNEGTLIIDNAYNGTHYTDMGSNVDGKSVGSVIIRNSGELKVPSGETLYVSGSWSNDNVFVAEAGGRVEFIGTNTVTVYGNTTFQELVCTGVTKQINFEAGELTAVEEDLIFGGPSDTGLVLRSTLPGTQWLFDLDPGATEVSVSYVDVRDSDATPGQDVTAASSKDSGNNDGWVFAVVGLTNWWTGGSSSNWTDSGNWSLGRPPAESDGGTVISNDCLYYPTLPSDRTLPYFEMKDPSFLSLGGFDLVIGEDAVIAGTLIATGTETITFKGNVDFTGGAFTQALSTVVLAGPGVQSMTSDGEVCHRLAVTNSGRTVTFADAVSTVYFRNESVALTFDDGVTATEFKAYTTEGGVTQTFAAASTNTITDMFQLGSLGKTNYLVSSSGGTKWTLDVDRIAYAKNVHVTDSDADPGMTIYPIDSFNGGNNDNWAFSQNWLTWDGSASADFTTAANWTPEAVPDATARVNIDGNGGNAPVLTSAISVKEVLLGGDETSLLTLDDSLTVGENVRVMGLGTLVASKPSTIGGDLTVLDGGVLTHGENATTEANKIDLAIGGDLYLAPDGEIDVDERGYQSSAGPGEGNYGRGGSHGGEGGWVENIDDRHTYGSIMAPTNCGSGGSNGDGGGAVRLTVSGETRLYGYVRANAGDWGGSYSSAGSGGSIFLTTGTLVGNGTLSAEGGRAHPYPAGGGGRISVVLTSGTSFDQVDMSVRGGEGNTSQAYNGANGTIYRQTGSQADGAGTVVVDCDGRAPDSASLDAATILLPDTLYVPGELVNATLIVTNDGTHLRIWTNLYVGDLLVYTNTTVTLTNMNLYVDKVEHHLDDVTRKKAGGPTNAVDHYDQVIWIGLPRGSLLLLR